MIRTYKRKLILNTKQQNRLLNWVGVCRLVYNMGLEIRKDAYMKHGKSVSKYELMRQLTEIRDIDWIKDVPSGSLQNVIQRLDNSYQKFFSGKSRYPKYAVKSKYKSITFRYVDAGSNHIKIPKIGLLKTFKDECITGTIKYITITIENDGYYASIICDNATPRFNSENQTIGLDMGIKHFCITSNGEFITNPNHFKRYERKLRLSNRSLSRKIKGSKKWVKQAIKLSLLHRKIGRVRNDFLQKISTQIAVYNSTVYMEDLNIQALIRGNLSKQIADVGWGNFRNMLSYKTNVIAINPKYTSQTCNECGIKDSKSRLSQSEFCCTSCGHISNADINAAKNILSKGIALGR